MKGAPLGPLDGVPASVKDILMVKGWSTTYGSDVLADKAPATADQIATFRSVVRSLDYDPRRSCDGPLDIDPRIPR